MRFGQLASVQPFIDHGSLMSEEPCGLLLHTLAILRILRNGRPGTIKTVNGSGELIRVSVDYQQFGRPVQKHFKAEVLIHNEITYCNARLFHSWLDPASGGVVSPSQVQVSLVSIPYRYQARLHLRRR
jgi:hypothetical protein